MKPSYPSNITKCRYRQSMLIELIVANAWAGLVANSQHTCLNHTHQIFAMGYHKKLRDKITALGYIPLKEGYYSVLSTGYRPVARGEGTLISLRPYTIDTFTPGVTDLRTPRTGGAETERVEPLVEPVQGTTGGGALSTPGDQFAVIRLPFNVYPVLLDVRNAALDVECGDVLILSDHGKRVVELSGGSIKPRNESASVRARRYYEFIVGKCDQFLKIVGIYFRY